ncbi:MAG: flagellar biosynthesis protein FliO [Shinella sp.]|nr:MAG: flagellar biosynthesis protein FliO [Shinella sp.]
MLDELVTAYGNRFLIAALGVSLALLCLFIVLRLLRNRAPSPFVRGGRNRQPRLQVLDAAAVDARRRIVLIRRDNVEHLVMIGGPTDIVIESGIGDERAYLSAVPVPAAVESAETAARIAPQAEPARVLPQTQPTVTAEPAPQPAPVEQLTVQPQPVRPEPVVARPQPQHPSRAPAPRTEPVAPTPAAVVAEEVAAPVAKPQPIATPTVAAPVAEAPQVHVEPAVAAISANAAPAPAYVPVAAPAPQVAPSAAPVIQPEQALSPAPSPIINAEDVLEAARQRVLPPSVESPAPPSARPPLANEQQPKKELSDFERVLEEEMALHLSANETSARTQFDVAPIVPETRPARPIAPPVIVTPPPGAPAATNREEPNLQTEIARIFGEMSVNRNN